MVQFLTRTVQTSHMASLMLLCIALSLISKVSAAAVQILQLRIKEREQKSLDIVSDGEYTMDLLNQLIHVGRTCKG